MVGVGPGQKHEEEAVGDLRGWILDQRRRDAGHLLHPEQARSNPGIDRTRVDVYRRMAEDAVSVSPA